MKPDQQLIHKLEYDLGFRDDAPDPVAERQAVMRKALTDEPGAILYYDPPKDDAGD